MTKFSLCRNYTNMLRGLAMVMIMVGHLAGEYEETHALTPVAATGVTLFLLLSGYGNNESFLKKQSWGGKKLLKIAIPYWIVRTIVLILCHDNISWPTLLSDYSFISIHSVFWFVGYIMKWYVAYWIGVNLIHKYRYSFWLALSLAFFAFEDSMVAVHSFDFLLGIVLSDHKKVIEWLGKRYFLLGIMSVVAFILFLGFKQLSLVRNAQLLCDVLQTSLLLSFAMAVILFAWKNKILLCNRVLLFISPITYELYMVHMKCLGLITNENFVYTVATTILFFVLSFLGAKALNKCNVLIFRNIKV